MKKKKKILKPHHIKRTFKIFINLNYIVGFLYAFYFFITTSRKTEMFVRRLWAYECWLILTSYGLFIYLFYLEKSALENRRGLFRFMKIQAVNLIEAPKEALLTWFDHIAENPKDYSFDSHLGVQVTQGALTKVGSKFETKEKFMGMPIRLKFGVTQADRESGLEFKVLNPKLSWLGLKGRFDYKLIDQDLIRLELVIFNHPRGFFKRVVSGMFYLSPLRILVAQQIYKEVKFIAKQVEAVDR
jgi:hypothetical protein